MTNSREVFTDILLSYKPVKLYKRAHWNCWALLDPMLEESSLELKEFLQISCIRCKTPGRHNCVCCGIPVHRTHVSCFLPFHRNYIRKDQSVGLTLGSFPYYLIGPQCWKRLQNPISKGTAWVIHRWNEWQNSSQLQQWLPVPHTRSLWLNVAHICVLFPRSGMKHVRTFCCLAFWAGKFLVGVLYFLYTHVLRLCYLFCF